MALYFTRLGFITLLFVALTGCNKGRSLEEVEALAVDSYNKANRCEERVEDLESKVDDLETRLNM